VACLALVDFAGSGEIEVDGDSRNVVRLLVG
jgi:hypothetical protein